jgi:U1 small nuclear ribonucleoprotein C
VCVLTVCFEEVADICAALGHDKAQNIIDQITSAYESGGGPPQGGFGFGPQHLGAPPPGFGGPPFLPPPPGFGGRKYISLL